MGTFLNPLAFNSGSRKGVDTGLNTQAGNLSSQANSTLTQRNAESGSLLPGYQSLLNSGYSPEEKSAINQSTLGGINSSYGAAGASAQRRMARTGNAAGYSSFLGAAARGKGQALAGQNLQNQKDFADETLRRKMMGLQGIQQMYGVDTSFLNSLNSSQNQLLGIGAGVYGTVKAHPGFLDSLGQAAGGALGNTLGSLI